MRKSSSSNSRHLAAILLVGGQGTRLRPLTLGTPKPLLPTAGVPFLAHQLAKAKSFGVERIVFATSYRASMFADAFGDGSAFGLRIDYVTEEIPLGTGGAIRNAATALTGGPDEPVLVLNGDILSGHDIGAQVDLHVSRGAAVTLHLTEVEDPSRFGCVPTDNDGRVTAFLEKTPNPVTNQINAGCYVFRRSVIDAIPEGQVVSVERATFPRLIDGGELVLGYLDGTYWLDVGTPAAFVKGSRDLVLGRLASPAMPGPCGELLALPGSIIAPDAE
ncbi:MAG TPA: nucleotidyltransferase family protein, partial [Thermopolyspora sp.]